VDLKDALAGGINHLQLISTDEQQNKLLTLLEQLVKWNKSYNLTAIKDPMEGLTLHLLDSLAVVPFIQQQRILDVGTGAGFPGLPLAIMLPNVQFTLLDSNSKKIRFIRQQIHLLELNNVKVVHARVEQASDERFDGIISRAFASIQDMLQMTEHLLAQNGRWLLMKGQYSKSEISALSDRFKELACHPLHIPGLSASRCLIELELV
jgi:16S rRNA (guanine527-N7)-methyltransferase